MGWNKLLASVLSIRHERILLSYCPLYEISPICPIEPIAAPAGRPGVA